jgi:hypothetical protein
MDSHVASVRRTSSEGSQMLVDSGAAGETVTGGSPRIRWRVVALGAAAGVPGVVFVAAFPKVWDLITGVTSLVVLLYLLVATLQGRDGDDLPPASAEFLAAADPTRPLDGSFASADAALAPHAASPTTEPLSAPAAASPTTEPPSAPAAASPTPEPPSAPTLTPGDSVPARELIGQLLLRRARRTHD